MAKHDSHLQFTTIAESMRDLADRLAAKGLADEAKEVGRLARALQLEVSFQVPTRPRSNEDVIAERFFNEWCEPTPEYTISGDDLYEAMARWAEENKFYDPRYGIRPDWVYDVPRWIRDNFPPTGSGLATDPHRYPFALKPDVKKRLDEQRAREESEWDKHRAELAAKRAKRREVCQRVLPKWFAKYGQDLPNKIDRRVVYQAAIKALKRARVPPGNLDQVTVNKLMRDAGFRVRKHGYWERRNKR